jgi:hypothetical protein
MPHRLFSVLEGSLLTSEQSPISSLTLRSQSALPSMRGPMAFLDEIPLPCTCSGTRPSLHGLAV